MRQHNNSNYFIPISLAIGATINLTGGMAGMILDATTEKLAIKYYPSSTSPIANIDIRLVIVGLPGSFKIGIFEDSGNAPNDAAQLGGYTASFTAPVVTGWTGLKALATNTGNLTVNTPVWIVIEYVSGTLDASNYIQINQYGTSSVLQNRSLVRHYNGTGWTTTTSVNNQSVFVVKHADGSYAGVGITASVARTSATDIFGTNTQGIRFKSGSQIKVQGVLYYLTKSGSPNNLVWSVYEGDTLKYSQTEIAANVLSVTVGICWFNSPVLLAADTNLYISASQESSGGSDTADYDLQGWTINPTYIESVVPVDIRHVYGTDSTPSAWSVDTTGILIPWCFPIITDMALDLDMSGGPVGNNFRGGFIN